jgi:O-antigen/teichoic acid export membrane protein
MIATPVADLLSVPKLAGYLWLLPVGVLLSGCYKIFHYWSVRTKSFAAIASTRISQTLTMVLIQIAASKLDSLALLLGQVASQGIGTTRLSLPAMRTAAFRCVSMQGVMQAAVRYRRFPMFSTWEGLSNTAGLQLPPLLLAALFSPAAAGTYSLANRVLNLPMSLVGNAIGQVFFSHAAEAHRAGRLGILVEQLHAKLAHIGFPPALLLMIVGPDLFALVFGESWRQAGHFACWMTPWLYLVFVSSPLSTLFAVKERLGQGLAFQLILLISRVGAIALGYRLGGIMLTIILFSMSSALCWLGFLIWLTRIAGTKANTMLQPTISAAVTAITCACPVIIAKWTIGYADELWIYALTISLVIIIRQYWKMIQRAYI